MRFRCFAVAILLALSALHAQPPPALPTWQDEIAKNFAPYHQLTTADFPINDKVHKETAFWLSTFIHPYYLTFSKPTSGGIVYTYVTDWTIFSGLDKNDTSHRSKAGNMKGNLPYAQALLDLNEIYARQMSALTAGQLPGGQGDSFPAARADLDARVKAFCEERFKALKDEQEAFMKETNQGENKKKVSALAAAIRKRLDDTPVRATPSATPVLSLIPSVSPTPSQR
jgi:hypothetical protein